MSQSISCFCTANSLLFVGCSCLFLSLEDTVCFLLVETNSRHCCRGRSGNRRLFASRGEQPVAVVCPSVRALARSTGCFRCLKTTCWPMQIAAQRRSRATTTTTTTIVDFAHRAMAINCTAPEPLPKIKLKRLRGLLV